MNHDREKLISEVKALYENLAMNENQQHFTQTTSNITAESYYEKLLGMVIKEINAGRFDSFRSGEEIVSAVANNKKKWLPEWGNKFS
ncbi:MAG TPA: hypothetical protein DEB10_09000 [Ruminococcaceae bacterium]|jgi:hypothetical protein|nr:hypothetical protein [Oscillospiraceae bacterium]HCA30851.1 hypothetical protein [Oscillospiraceae bacterium]